MSSSPEAMEAKMIANLPEKTGKSLPEWLGLLGEMRSQKHGQIVKHLKSEHAVTHGFANLIARYLLQADQPPASADDLISQQYSAAKAGLRPIYDALIARVTALGSDVEVAARKTYVTLRRGKQFAIVQPSTRTRLDVGLKLAGKAAGDRLEPSGSFSSMVSHRVRLTEVGHVDDELVDWLREAYEQA